MVSVYTFSTTNVAVGIVHFAFPLLAVCISATTNTTLWLFDGNVESVYFDVSFLVVTSFLLCIGRIGINLCFLFFACTLRLVFFCYSFGIVCYALTVFAWCGRKFVLLFLLCLRRLCNFAVRRNIILLRRKEVRHITLMFS